MEATAVVVTGTLLLYHLPISFRFQEHHQNHSHTHTHTRFNSDPIKSKIHCQTHIGQILSRYKQVLQLGQILGKGKLGITYFCTENSIGLNYAGTSILKRNLMSEDDRENFRREIRICNLYQANQILWNS